MTPGKGTIRVRNWDKFQHYKDRSPPWIKLYNDLLENYAFSRLQDASKAHLVGIWLLASRTENDIPADEEWIAGKIGATQPIDLEPLIDGGFIEVSGHDSETIASRKQDAIPEGEGEGEREAERETEASGVCVDQSTNETAERYVDPDEPDGSDMPHPGSRMSASELIHIWSRSLEDPLTPAERKRHKGTAISLTNSHSRDELLQAMTGMTAIFPHCPPKNEPWDLSDLRRKFTKAKAKARDHPEIRAMTERAAFLREA